MNSFLPDEDSSTGLSASDELASYLADPRTRIDALDWWKINEGLFPRLARMARDFLAIPGKHKTLYLI